MATDHKAAISPNVNNVLQLADMKAIARGSKAQGTESPNITVNNSAQNWEFSDS